MSEVRKFPEKYYPDRSTPEMLAIIAELSEESKASLARNPFASPYALRWAEEQEKIRQAEGYVFDPEIPPLPPEEQLSDEEIVDIMKELGIDYRPEI